MSFTDPYGGIQSLKKRNLSDKKLKLFVEIHQWKLEDLSKSVSVAADLAPSASSLQPQSQPVTLSSGQLQNSHPESRFFPF